MSVGIFTEFAQENSKCFHVNPIIRILIKNIYDFAYRHLSTESTNDRLKWYLMMYLYIADK